MRAALPWIAAALIALILPHLFSGGFGLSLLCRMGIGIVFALSFNMLLGQGGMLDFGHAVFLGMGGFIAMHAMRLAGAGWFIPTPLLPLAGALGGLLVAIPAGWIATRRDRTAFAMITLGLAELIVAVVLMFPHVFGGEEGLNGDRSSGPALLGLDFGTQFQVFHLIAAWTLVCALLMWRFTRTPLGRMLNAVRDNPERVEFVGYDTQKVRYFAFIVAAFFAGISGGLAALNFEIVTSEVVSGYRSGAYLLFTFLGGATFFFGPIIGAILMVLAFVLLSEFTKAWLLYLGLIFLFMVMYAPGGVASLIMMNLRVAMFGHLRKLWVSYLALAFTAMVVLLGAACMIEMVYHLQLNAALGPELTFLGAKLDSKGLNSWFGAGFVILTGLGLFEVCRRQFAVEWSEIQEDIEKEIKRRESL